MALCRTNRGALPSSGLALQRVETNLPVQHMLSWFDKNPQYYWWLACLVVVLAAGVTLRSLRAGVNVREEPRTDWGWACVILAVLIAGRWPTFFITRGLNPDESQLIAGALTLRHDPMFWRSVDGGTAGPFDFYALLPAGWLVGADHYLSARITALLLLAAALLFVHQLLAREFGHLVARVTTLGGVVFEAFTLHPDFLHYSTELVPISLLSAACYLGWCRFQVGTLSLGGCAGLGALLGAIPLAKLQAGPLAALVGLWLVTSECRARERPWPERRRRLASLVLGACGPAVFFAALLALTNEWKHAIIPYFLHNLSYVAASYLKANEWIDAMGTELALSGSAYLPWLGGLAAMIVWALGWSLSSPRRPRCSLAIFATVFFFMSVACIVWPRRPFPHYLQFSVVPATLLAGAIVGWANKALAQSSPPRRVFLLLGCLSLALAPLFLSRGSSPHPYVGKLHLHQEIPRGAVGREILRYGRPGESLGVWGWSTHYYAETGMWQATRDAFSQAEILDNPYYDYFRQRYLGDFQRNLPPVFVDATALARANFPTQPLAHDEIFPQLAAVVVRNYTRAGDVGGVRVYVRKDRMPPSRP